MLVTRLQKQDHQKENCHSKKISLILEKKQYSKNVIHRLHKLVLTVIATYFTLSQDTYPEPVSHHALAETVTQYFSQSQYQFTPQPEPLLYHILAKANITTHLSQNHSYILARAIISSHLSQSQCYIISQPESVSHHTLVSQCHITPQSLQYHITPQSVSVSHHILVRASIISHLTEPVSQLQSELMTHHPKSELIS